MSTALVNQNGPEVNIVRGDIAQVEADAVILGINSGGMFFLEWCY